MRFDPPKPSQTSQPTAVQPWWLAPSSRALPHDFKSTLALAALGAILCGLAWSTARAIDDTAWRSYIGLSFAHGAVYLTALVLLAKRRPAPRDLWLVLAVAIVMRLIAWPTEPNLSTDVYRYIWDGRIQLGGINPYLYVPADPALTAFRDTIVYPLINQKDTAVTIYPPAAQLLFLASQLCGGGIAGVKIMVTVFDAITIAALMGWLRAKGWPLALIAIYAWHPLPVWEFISQMHIDGALAAFVAVGLWAAQSGRQGWTGAAFAAAALIKYFPVILLPALWRRFDWRLPAAFTSVVVMCYVPYVLHSTPNVFGFLATHLDNEGYAAGWGFHIVWLLRDFNIANVSGPAYVIAALLILAALAIWSLCDRAADQIKPAAIAVLGATFVFLTSPHYPWYFGFLIAIAVTYPHPALLVFTLVAPMLYWPRPPGGLTWTEIYAVTYGLPLLVLALTETWQRLRLRRRFQQSRT